MAGTGTQCDDPTAVSACGDGGLADQAQLNFPDDVEPIDGGPGFLIADARDLQIRRVGTDGTVATVAGTGDLCADPTGPCGDGGPAVEATFRSVNDVDFAPDGSLLVADFHANKIRRIDPDGTISTFAGTGEPCESSVSPCGDGGPATQARLKDVDTIAVAPDGSVLLSMSGPGRIRRIEPDGTIATVAGTGIDCPDSTGLCGDGGPATTAQLNLPSGLAAFPDGSFAFSDGRNQRVRYVDSGGTITTLAGTGEQCADPTQSCGDLEPARQAQLNLPTDLIAGPNGSLLLTDFEGGRVRVIAPPPRLQLSASVRDLGGGAVRAGDVLRYRVSAANLGDDELSSLDADVSLPPGLEFVPGSIMVGGTSQSDSSGDDTAEFNATAPGVIYARLGAGADPTAGGSLGVGGETAFSFEARIPPGAAIGETYTTTAAARSIGATSRAPTSANSEPLNIVVEERLGTCADPVRGTTAPDRFEGSPAEDGFLGGGGGDSIRGLDGGDCLFGEGEGDRIQGGLGDDYLRGGDGADRIRGNQGDDRIEVADDRADRVNCGPGGGDSVSADIRDDVLNCERVAFKGGTRADRVCSSRANRWQELGSKYRLIARKYSLKAAKFRALGEAWSEAARRLADASRRFRHTAPNPYARAGYARAGITERLAKLRYRSFKREFLEPLQAHARQILADYRRQQRRAMAKCKHANRSVRRKVHQTIGPRARRGFRQGQSARRHARRRRRDANRLSAAAAHLRAHSKDLAEAGYLKTAVATGPVPRYSFGGDEGCARDAFIDPVGIVIYGDSYNLDGKEVEKRIEDMVEGFGGTGGEGLFNHDQDFGGRDGVCVGQDAELDKDLDNDMRYHVRISKRLGHHGHGVQGWRYVATTPHFEVGCRGPAHAVIGYTRARNVIVRDLVSGGARVTRLNVGNTRHRDGTQCDGSRFPSGDGKMIFVTFGSLR